MKNLDRQNLCVFALPYLADYREKFFDVISERLDGNLILLHPETSLHPSTRVFRHEKSMLSEPARSILGGFESQRSLVKRVASIKPAVVVIEANTRDLTYLRLLIWCRLFRVPVAIWGLGRYSRQRSFAERLVGALMTFAMVSLSDRVFGKGSAPTEYYSAFTRNKQKVVTAPNSSGLEESLISIMRTPRESPSSTSPFRILYVGRVISTKDLDLLIQALGQLKTIDHWELHIVGEGPAEGDLQELSKVMGVSSRVHFHGNLKGGPLLRHFANADVLTLPGKGGLVVPEALAAGLPIVSGPLGHAGDGTLAELLVDGVNAFVASTRTVEGLRVVVAEAYSAAGSGDLYEMQMKAREKHQGHGGIEAMSNVFLNFIEPHIDGPPGFNVGEERR